MGLQSVQKISKDLYPHLILQNIVFPQTWQNGAPIWGLSEYKIVIQYCIFVCLSRFLFEQMWLIVIYKQSFCCPSFT